MNWSKSLHINRILTISHARTRTPFSFSLFNLLVQPSIRTQSAVVHSSLGKALYLRCSAHVPSDGQILWSRTDQQKFDEQNKIFRQYDLSTNTLQSSLYIKDLDKTHFGLYQCRVESRGGVSSATIELKGNVDRPGREWERKIAFCFFHLGIESRRLTSTPPSRSNNNNVNEHEGSTTSRIQILKRNQSKFRTWSLIIHLCRFNIVTTSMENQTTTSSLSLSCLIVVLIQILFSRFA